MNELLGLFLLGAAVLSLLAMLSYAPTDPSLDTAGGEAVGRAAHNWAGVFGAYAADAVLQGIGISAFLLPLLLVRVGISWMWSKAAGSPIAKLLGLLLWVVFAPAAVSLVLHGFFWRGLPLGGATGSILADQLVLLLNLPGAALVVGLLAAVSLYLLTTFSFGTANVWFGARFGFVQRLQARWSRWRNRRRQTAELAETDGFASKRERAARRRGAEPAASNAAVASSSAPSTTLLSGLFGWLSRRRGTQPAVAPASEPAAAAPEPVSMWEAMPRTLVDAPEPTALGTATAAALPFAEELARRATPKRAIEDVSNFGAAAAASEEISEFLDVQVKKVPTSTKGEQEAAEFLSARMESLAASKLGRRTAMTATAAAADTAPSVPSLPVSAPLSAPVSAPLSAPVSVPPSAPVSASLAVSEPVSAAAEPKAISFGKRADSDQVAVAIVPKSVRGYKLPPSSLLFHSEEHASVREDALREEARILVEKCGEFDVDGQVTQINPGPVVTTFEFKPDAGVKYSRVTGLADDLCLAMAAESILIERMPGKSTVGIQVPNAERETIWLRDVVECESFAQSKSRLAIALGKDINGRIVTADLASMPHVLIAGSTGSGKSVAINAMIMSVLFKSTPEQVRMILVDPKRVELGMYEGIPHLFTPIITEAKLAANALRNAVREMERRLKLLARHHVRNIDQYNKMTENATADMFEDPAEQEPLPYIMIIIDELADLMMLDRSNVEESITRLAQMARAVGIHLVLATQRPSVDVITGLIKANVPTRMSFRLATKVDSRTIIDSNGAESLLGRGDMLYLPPGTSRVQRVHAPFVTEKEINAVTEFWKAQGEAEYVQGFLEGPKEEAAEGEAGATEGDANDPMFDDAVRLVFEFGKASTSLLQRRLRIGYGRAAHLIDLMYRDGLVGPADGSKPRELLKPATWLKEMDEVTR